MSPPDWASAGSDNAMPMAAVTRKRSMVTSFVQCAIAGVPGARQPGFRRLRA